MIADGALIADRYRVLGKLGQGGMGQVYLAEHVRMGRKSALKIMNPGMASDPDAVNRFNREAANASRITHPNVAAVYDFGETADGLLFLAMEYVEGEPLSAIIEREGALPLVRAAAIARQVAEALRIAHRLGIVHRDLKPDNIMVTKDFDGNDQVKVVDFGIAKAMQNEAQKVTRTGLSIGTPEYMSPEQLASENIDGRSDIYSLGLVTFAMFTGQLPFPAVTTRETLVARLIEKPARLAAVRPDIAWPSGLQVVMDKVLASNAPERYQDAGDFARELMSALDTAPVMGSAAASVAHQQSVASASSGPTERVLAPATSALRTRATPEPAPEGNRRMAVFSAAVVGLSLLLGLVAILSRNDRRARARSASATVVAAPTAAETTAISKAALTTAAPRTTVASSQAGTRVGGSSAQAAPRPAASSGGAGSTSVTPVTPVAPPAPAQPATPARIGAMDTFRDSTRMVAQDLEVMRRAFAAGDRSEFQPAYRRVSALMSRLVVAHPRDPAVAGLQAQVAFVRDSVRTVCQAQPGKCVAVGLAPLRRQRRPPRG